MLKNWQLKKGKEISSFYMIGDNPRSDIKGANVREGWTSILVKTGVFN